MPPGPLQFIDNASTLPSPRLSLVRAADATVILVGSGQPDRVYRVEATDDLVSWSMLGVVEADGTGHIEFLDSHATAHPTRFYRVGPH